MKNLYKKNAPHMKDVLVTCFCYAALIRIDTARIK
uniref:Uncharacterized protein n=1 Tax=Myoviridae sp. ctP4M4 TaxID=2826647 RepID=A0A8S5N280_9CAUD|nr:MAG TPA: hypothetical protein [Myoviridae sp. ctP4M4]